MNDVEVPRVYGAFRDDWARRGDAYLRAYAEGWHSFVPNLLPEQAMDLPVEQVLAVLRRRLGDAVDLALAHVDPDEPTADAPPAIGSPVRDWRNGDWLKTSNLAGINVRTVGSFWNVIPYVLTLPEAQDAIHLLPVWEPGVVGSLYGISSWQINDEFFSPELAEAVPGLETVEKQLKAAVNLLHAMGRTVGMDVIPHTDRFSEIVLAQPHCFEWLQREATEIVDHSADLHERVQARILDFLAEHGPAVPGDVVPAAGEGFFSEAFPEARRLRILFGRPKDRAGRERRRNALVGFLYAHGYEPVPATMAPPYRGLRIDPDTAYTDSQGQTWYDYAITEPQGMSRVFGPLTRYKLYGRMDDNAEWAIDFERPRTEVWRYVCAAYHDVQRRYGFDFMRGDMSHVQMRPGGVPEEVDDYYDILRAVKRHIQQEGGVPYFAYFAETFLAGRNVMLYGDEVDHLEASEAEATLGDLQSTAVGSPEFLQRLRWYYDLAATRHCTPCFTVMTGDKDDPRFDGFYLRGNAVRLFMALFLTDVPSYTALGFETRDIHYRAAPNEHYTKLYVFQETGGPKATSGPYRWGRNGALFHDVTRLRLYAEGMLERVRGRPTAWLIAPDATAENKHVAWTQGDGRPAYVFVANTDTGAPVENVDVPCIRGLEREDVLRLEFSTHGGAAAGDETLAVRGRGFRVRRLEAGEGRVYRVRSEAGA